MKTMRITALSGALLLALVSMTVPAAAPKPLQVDFNKCFDHKGFDPYIVTFSGTASGDVSGTVEARVSVYIVGIEPGQTHIQADYVVAGSLPFTARVGGRVDDKTNKAVLRGYVSEGPAWLLGAGVLDEFLNYKKADGTRCSVGALHITPRWKQSHDDND